MTLINKIYRGFVRCKINEPKRVNEPFKREKVSELPSFDDRINCTNVAGVFEQPYGMLDFDNEVDWLIVKQLVKEFNLKLAIKDSKNGSHNGGGHLYGKFPKFHFHKEIKNNTHIYNAIGLELDIKSGWSNTVDSIKRGTTLLTEFDYNGDLDDLDEFPYWLIGDTRYIKLGTRDKGGRDATLNTRRGILAKIGYTHEQVLEVFNIINKYVFSEPLSQSEIESKADKERLKEDRNNPNFKLYGDVSFLDAKGKTIEEPHKMAKYLFNKYHVCNYNSRTYFYDGEKYTDSMGVLLNLISEEFEKLSASKIKDIITLIEAMGETNVKEENDLGYVRCINGIVDLRNAKLLNNTPDVFVTNYIPHKFVNTTSEWGEFFFNHVTNGEKDTIQYLMQIVGRCLWNSPIDAEALIITGCGGNGKTTFLKMIESLLGMDNFSETQWGDLGVGFATDDGRNAMAITCDELKADTFHESGFFFKVSSGGVVTGNAKYGKRSKYRFKAMLISACNDLPKLDNLELTEALARRLTLLKFRKDLKKPENRIHNLNKERKKESFIEWLFYQAVKHFTKVIETDEYDLPRQAYENMDEYLRELDKLNMWVKSKPQEYFIDKPLTAINNDFSDFLDGEECPRKRGDMSNSILKYHHLKLKSIGTERVFKNIH